MRLRLTLIAMLFGCLGMVMAQGPSQEKHVLKAPEVRKDIYPESADANREIKEALALAAKEKKRVLLVFGGNWCYDCHVLDRALHEGVPGKLVTDGYELVHVDIGRGEKNTDISAKYKMNIDKGVPAVAVLDSKGKLLFHDKGGEFEGARRMSEEELTAFLQKWRP